MTTKPVTPKRVVITGASSGIGHATALLLAQQGHHLLLTARRADLLDALAKECRQKGVHAETACFDLSLHEPCSDLPKALQSFPPGETVLVNNAGIAQFGEFAGTPFADHWRQITLNVGGTLAATHALVPTMLAHGSGQIINVLSIAAETDFPGAAVYSASKAAVRQFARSLSLEYRRQGLRITNLLPGAVDTPLWDAQSGHPPKDQMLTPQTLAETIAHLINQPPNQVTEELRITPPNGIL